MEVIAFVGPSGSGKSHRAIGIAHQYNCDAIIDDAKAQAAGMIRRAESEIAQERVKAFAEVKKELSGMAVDIAEQMVSRELNAKDQDKLVDEFIRNAGDKA